MFCDDFHKNFHTSSLSEGQMQRPFNSSPRHTASDALLQMHLPYVKKFIMALPHCLPMEMGFHRLHRTTHAYCPLQLLMKGWRKRFGLCTMKTEQHICCTQSSGKTSNALIQHIRDMARSDPLHELVLLYLEEHFHYSSVSGYMKSIVGHKSLYPMYSTEWNCA